MTARPGRRCGTLSLELLELDDACPQRLELLLEGGCVLELEGGAVLVLGLTQLQQLLEL